MVFFVTSKCNSRCKFCFYWRNLNSKEPDLSLEEIEKIAHSLPQFSSLLLSGGEPFLRKDLAELIKIFYEENKVRNVSVPTNGILVDKIATTTEEILKLCPDINLNINFSLDGVREYHDKLRGVFGNYRKTILAIKELNKLEERHFNLGVRISTVVCRDNLEKIGEFLSEIGKEKINFLHYFEIVRGKPRLPGEKTLTPKRLKEVYKEILKYQEENYRKNIQPKTRSGYLWLWFRMAMLYSQYRIQLDNFLENKPWGYKCEAGRKIVVLDYNSDFRLCELKKPEVNVRKIDYDLGKFIHSQTYEKALREVKNCDCTHVCFILETIYTSPKFVFVRFPINLFKTLLRKYDF